MKFHQAHYCIILKQKLIFSLSILSYRTRNCIERCFGVVKKRFYALTTGLRVRSPETAGKLIQCAFLLHNMCLRNGDIGQDFQVQAAEQRGDLTDPADGFDPSVTGNDRRRQFILQSFAR